MSEATATVETELVPSRSWRIRPMPYESSVRFVIEDAPAVVAVRVVEEVAADPNASRAVARTLALVLEVLDGRRPVRQLDPRMGPEALRYLRRLAESYRPRRTSRVLRTHVTQPNDGVAEVAALVGINGQPRALAARFDRQHDGWRCTALQVL